MNGHLARHALERLLVDDPRDTLAPELRTHLAGCERCAERMQALLLARSQYAARRPATRFAQAVAAEAARQAPAVRLRRLRWPLLASVAAAAVVMLAVPAPPEIRYKGAAAALQVYVRSGSATRALRPGERLFRGDQLAFAYTLARPQHLLLFGIDDAGTISRYFPEAPAQAAALPAGATRQLPLGIELDARRGRERLVALFSPAPLDEARARDALAAALRAARARGEGIAELGELSLDAAQVSVWFEKP